MEKSIETNSTIRQRVKALIDSWGIDDADAPPDKVVDDILTARREAANEVIEKIAHWSLLNMKHEFRQLSQYLDSLSKEYNNEPK